MPRKAKTPGLPIEVMQAWALINETCRSIPFLGLTLAVIFLELSKKAKVLSPAMVTLLEGLLTAGALTQFLAPVAGGSTAAAGAIGAGLLAKGAAVSGAAGSAIAGLPLLPAAAVGGAAAGVTYASYRTGQEAAKQIEQLDAQLRSGSITKKQASDQLREILVPLQAAG